MPFQRIVKPQKVEGFFSIDFYIEPGIGEEQLWRGSFQASVLTVVEWIQLTLCTGICKLREITKELDLFTNETKESNG